MGDGPLPATDDDRELEWGVRGDTGMRCSAAQPHTHGMTTLSAAHRFRDPRSTTYDFIGSILVRCPNCAKVAHVVPATPGCRRRESDTVHAQVSCLPRLRAVTGLDRQSRPFSRGTAQPATDPYFGTPLRLQRETRHGWLWAYNLDHLDLLQHFVQASLRERAPWYDTRQKMTLVARLPPWIKRARNRDEILRAVTRIRSSLTSDSECWTVDTTCVLAVGR